MPARRPTSPIPRRQWHLPAGFHPDGRPATFTHVVDPRRTTVDGDDLTDDQRRALTLLRLGRQKSVRLGSLADGVIDQARALDEVRRRTPLGEALVDIEHRAIRLMREYAERHRPRPTRRTVRKRSR